MSARDVLVQIRLRAARAHAMTASDVGVRTRYTETIELVEALETVLAVLDAPDPDEHEHDESVYLERANDRLDNIRSAIETALEGR